MKLAMQRWFTMAVRIGFGGMFVMAGATKILPIQSAPADLPQAALSFMGGLAGAGYFMPLLGAVEVLAGLAILSGFFVPLALIVLAPVVVHIALFHTVLAPALGMATFVVGSEAYLAWTERGTFAPLLAARPRRNVEKRAMAAGTRLAA